MNSLGFELSEDDTFVSKYAFLAEEALEIPTDPNNATEVWISRKRKSNPPFVDFPKVKILSDAGNNRELFSESAIGKITLLGNRMEQAGKTFREGQFHLASWIQDICMSLIYRKEFVYFPRFLVGTGKPILFGAKENASAFLRMHRCGRLQRSYSEIMEASLTGDVLGTGRYTISSFLVHSRSDDHIRVVEREFNDDWIKDAQLFTQDCVRGYEPFLASRLRTLIISESELVAKLEEQRNLLSESAIRSRPLLVKTLARGEKEYSVEQESDFLNLWITNSKLLRVRRQERFYDRKVAEERLGAIHLTQVSGLLHPLPLEDRVDTIRSELDREVKKLYDWVTSNPQRLDDIPRALLRDDLFAVTGNQLTSPKLLIVSDDMELVRYSAVMRGMNWRASRVTYHISMRDWILADLTPGKWFEPDEVFVDEGSLDGFLDACDAAGVDPPDPDGLGIEGRFRPIRPTYKLQIPTDILELHRLRGELPDIAESGP
jgi:hypothetical protein